MIEFLQRKKIVISSILLAIILVAGCVLYASKNKKNTIIESQNEVPETKQALEVPSAISAYSSDTTNATEKPSFLIKNQDQAITDLITSYYNAMLNADKEAYDLISVDDDSIDVDVLLRKMEYITGYDSQEIYVTQGTGNAVIVAYIVYDLKINSIKTPAPSIDQLLIINVDGKPKLYFNELTVKETKQIETIRNHEEVKALIQKVNRDFESAIQSDQNLFDFYKSLAERAIKK